MRVLALDSSTRDGSVAVFDDTGPLVERPGDATRPYAERLPGDLLAVLSDAGWVPGDVDVFAVAAGPGSFTGLRIGIAAMQGFALVTARPMVAVSLLEVLGHLAAVDQAAGTRIGVWIDAYRREVFSALYTVGVGEPFTAARLQSLEPPDVAPPAVIVERWRNQPPQHLIGNGAVLYASVLAALSPAVNVLAPPPLATAIARLAHVRASHHDTVSPAAVQPYYIRRPDVEVTREHRRS